jgi:hypothetical protein
MRGDTILGIATALYLADPNMRLDFRDNSDKIHHKPKSVIAAKKKAAKEARKRKEKKRLKGKK